MPPLLSQFWQLYNSVTLFRLARHEDCKEWQVRIALTVQVLKCQTDMLKQSSKIILYKRKMFEMLVLGSHLYIPHVYLVAVYFEYDPKCGL